MPKPKRLSGADVIRILGVFGFGIASQRGSHIKLRRVLNDGTRQTLTVPNHRELDRGTVTAIYRQALRYISAEELAPHFFNN
jgi:predicted RNA binding protein YcfA (HicA-like mRNA interferase family)